VSVMPVSTVSSSPGDRFVFAALLSLVALSPLPFGANTPFWSALLSALGLGLLLTAVVRMAPGQRMAAGAALRDLRWPLILFAVAMAFAFFQALPGMPEGMAHPVWQEMEQATGKSGWGSISIAPGATVEAVVRIFSYAAIFLAALFTCGTPERARFAFRVMAIAGVLYAAYGIAVELAGLNMVAWAEKDAYEGYVTATFINRNSFAAYAGIGAVCALSVLGAMLVRQARRSNVPRSRRLEGLFSLLFGAALPWIFCALTILAALMMTGSRGGAVAALAGIAAMIVLWVAATRRRGRFSAVFTLAFAGVILAGIVLAFGRPLLLRFEEKGFDDNAREASTAIVLSAIEDAPLLGSGFGTFPQAFTLYRTDSLNPAHAYDKAHNTFLENAMEMGIPMSLVFFSAIGLVVLLLARLMFRQRHGHDLLAAAAASIALVALHSVIDFSLQIPAINATLAFIAGTALSPFLMPREAT